METLTLFLLHFASKKNKMRTVGVIALLLFIVFGCELPPRSGMTISSSIQTADRPLNIENEEYVMVTTAVTMPMYVNHDQAAFKRWGEKMNVKVSILGPAEWDVPAQINTI